MTTSCVLCIYLSVKRWSVLTVRDTSAACMMRSRLHRVHHKVDFLCTVFVNSVLDLFSSLWEAPPESCFREFPGPRTGWPGCLEKWVDANPKIRVEEGMDAPVWVKTRMRRVEIPDPDGGIWRSIFGHYTWNVVMWQLLQNSETCVLPNLQWQNSYLSQYKFFWSRRLSNFACPFHLVFASRILHIGTTRIRVLDAFVSWKWKLSAPCHEYRPDHIARCIFLSWTCQLEQGTLVTLTHLALRDFFTSVHRILAHESVSWIGNLTIDQHFFSWCRMLLTQCCQCRPHWVQCTWRTSPATFWIQLTTLNWTTG